MTITIPAGEQVRLASAIKVLLDGVICGLHAHDGFEQQDVSHRLAEMLGEESGVVGQHLADETHAVLGKKVLVRPRLDRVQWHPDDDACVFAEVRIVPSPSTSTESWRTKGRLRTVSASMATRSAELASDSLA